MSVLGNFISYYKKRQVEGKEKWKDERHRGLKMEVNMWLTGNTEKIEGNYRIKLER